MSAPKGHRQFLGNNKKKTEFVAQIQVVGECDGESGGGGVSGRGLEFSIDYFHFLSGKGSEVTS